MQTLDTNVLVRLVLGDDPAQAALAARCWSDAQQAGGVFLPVVVLVELVWVLDRAARLDRPRIHSELVRLTNLDGVVIQYAEIVHAAVRCYAITAADFADCVIRESARVAQSLPVHTFDRRFARADGVSLIANR